MLLHYKPSHLILAFLTFFIIGTSILAQSGRSIMKKVRDQSRIHKTLEQDVFMLILNAKGKERKRYFSNKRKYKGTISNSMIKFYKPSSVKGTALLTISNEKASPNKQWIYLPALRSLKQLSVGDKNKSFMGSDFTNDDIAGRELDRDRHKLLKTEGDYHYIRSIPKSKKDIYSKLELKVHKKINMLIEAIFYDKKGRKLKTLENKKFKKIKGMYVISESLMANHLKKSSTKLKVSSIKVGHKIGDNDVGIKGLKR